MKKSILSPSISPTWVINPDSETVKNGWFAKKTIKLKDYDGDVYGGDVIKTAVENI